MNLSVKILLVVLCFSGLLNAQKNKSELEKQKKALQAEIKETNQLIQETRKNKKASLTQLKALNQKLANRIALIGTIESEIEDLNSTIGVNTHRIADLQVDLERLKFTYARMVRRAYMNRNHRSALLLVFSSQSIQQVYKRLYYLKTYSVYRKEQARRLESTRMQLDGQMQSLQVNLNSKRNLLDSEQVQKNELSQEKKDQEIEINALKKKEQTLKKTLAAKEATKKKLDAEIRKVIEREIARERTAAAKKKEKPKEKGTATASSNTKATPKETVLKVTPETAALSGKFEANKGKLPWPVEKGVITETFGNHAHPVLKGITTNNNGIDIATSKDARVKSVYEGEVMGVVSIPGSGSAVLIKHGEYISVYSNLKSTSVAKGQKVKTGQALGTAGENEDGVPEAHFEIWKEKTKLNPASWLAR
jgi:septal ring factor EnvC (AmiA/AmiB activator)